VSIRRCGSSVEEEESGDFFFFLTAEERGRRSGLESWPEGRPDFAWPGAVERDRDEGSFLAAALVEVELPGLADFFVRRGVGVDGAKEEGGGGAERRPEDAEGSTGGVGGGGVAAADVSSPEDLPGRRGTRELLRVTCRVSGSAGTEPDGAGCAGAA